MSRQRRGGFGDAGTLGDGGCLPQATEVVVTSEAKLADELCRIQTELAPDSEWSQRVMALVRLEGIVLGGAASRYAAALPPLLTHHLRASLEEQVRERRSAVSRQACHVVVVLAEACGVGFEPLAEALLPALFKAQGMSITVVTEAADACARALFRHCPSPRMLKHVAAVVVGDKNVRLRHAASEYLLQAVAEWSPAVYARDAAALEAGILAAAQDAGVDTRANGRAAFAAYFGSCPEAARALIQRLPDKERALKEKLVQEAERSAGAGAVASVAPGRQKHARRASFGGSPAPAAAPPVLARSLSAVPTSLFGPALRLAKLPAANGNASSSAQRPGDSGFHSARGAAVAVTPVLPPRPASAGARTPERNGQRSVDAAVRLGAATPKPLFVAPADRERAAVGAGGAQRVAVVADQQGYRESLAETPASIRRAKYSHNNKSPARAALRVADDAAAQQLAGFWQEAVPAAVPLASALAALKKPGAAWDAKVELYEGLQAAVQPGGERQQEAAELVDQLVDVLFDGTGDAHFKVATAALQALLTAVSNETLAQPLGLFMDRIVPALFARVADTKEQIRQLADGALGALPARQPPEVLLPGLTRALHLNKAPRVRCAVMDYFSAAAGSQDHALAALAQPGQQHPTALRALLAGCLALATDKHPDMRRSAQQAVAAAYVHGDTLAVANAIAALPPSPRAAVSRALAQRIGPLEADLELAGASERRVAAAPEAVAAASPAMRRALQLPSRSASPAAASPPVSSPSAASSLLSRDPSNRSFGSLQTSLVLPQDSPTSPQTSLALAQDSPKSPKSVTAELLPSAAMTPQPSLGLDALQPFEHLLINPQPSPAISPPAATKPASTASPLPAATKAALTTKAIALDATTPLRLDSPALEPLDPMTASELEQLVQQLAQGAAPAMELLQDLADLAPLLRGPKWELHYLALVQAAGAALDPGGDQALRQAGVQALAAINACASALAVGQAAPRIVLPLLRCAVDSNVELAAAAGQAVSSMLGLIDPAVAVSLLIERLPAASVRPPFDGAEAAMLLAALRSLHPAVQRLRAAQLAGVLPLLAPPLCTCYNSANADIRKAAVDCIVASWLAVGEATVKPHLQALSAAQHKLLSIYLERAQRAKQAAR